MEDCPATQLELEAWFATEQSCRDYLFRLRWPDGFRCARCGSSKAWPAGGVLFQCAACDYKASVTAGTIFQDTHQPLTLWFRAMWWMTSQKNGASALGLQRILGLASYKTAGSWLHKLRRAMIRPGRDRLSGRVEVDETYLGSREQGVTCHRWECTRPGFRRSWRLSFEVGPDKAEAKRENGVLQVVLPKSKEAPPQKIAVKVG